MRPIAPAAQALVSALARPLSLPEKLLGRDDEDLRILAALETLVEAGVVPHLLPYVFGGSRAVSRAAARVLSTALRAATAADLIEVDEQCRRTWSIYLPPSEAGWRNFRPAEVSRFGRFGDDETAVVGVASFHGSGWMREAAVTRLDAIASGKELPFLLLRTNDWVAPVAERAAQAVRRRLTPEFATAFVSSLPLLRRLEVSRRREHRPMLDAISALLKEPACRTAVEQGLDASDRLGRRFLYRVARGRPDFDRVALLRRALRDSDSVVRLQAVVDARTNLSPAIEGEILATIIDDSYPRIRREGIAAAVQLRGDDGQRALEAALLDRNQVVREVARFGLSRAAEVRDFAQRYRACIESIAPKDRRAGTLAIAIAGLGETGVEEDAESLTSFLDHPQPSVRRASIRAIAALSIVSQLAALVRKLEDPSSGVRKTVRGILRPHAASIGVGKLRAIYREATHSHSRFDAIAVAAGLGKWDIPPVMLEASADPDESIRSAGRRWLRIWVAKQNRTSVQPTQHQLLELGMALSEFERAIDPSIAIELRAVHRYWTGTAVTR